MCGTVCFDSVSRRAIVLRMFESFSASCGIDSSHQTGLCSAGAAAGAAGAEAAAAAGAIMTYNPR